MKCIAPITLMAKVPKYKNGKWERSYQVPCGKCAACMSNKRNQWSVRLQKELQYSTSAAFVTLTYSEDYFFEQCIKSPDVEAQIKYNSSVHKSDFQDFMKRFRYHDTSKNIRYFAVGEYGSKSNRPHYHVLLFNIDFKNLDMNIAKAWPFGMVDIGTVTDASIHYVTSYVITSKYKPYKWCEPSFALMSRKPGIGHAYLEKNAEYFTDNPTNAIRLPGGYLLPLPRFYKDKLYNSFVKDYLASTTPIQEDPDYLTYIRWRENNDIILKRFSKNKKKL